LPRGADLALATANEAGLAVVADRQQAEGDDASSMSAHRPKSQASRKPP
jgi:hypothetical protein